MPDPAAAKAAIAGVFGRAAPAYDTVIPFFGTFAGHLVAAARLQSGERVLDVACGRGAVVLRAASAVGSSGQAVGVDLAPEMVETAAGDAVVAGLGNVNVRVGDAEHLDFGDEAFDAVLCGFGVFFFPDPDRALAEAGRVLRSGGRFAASTFVDGVAGFRWAPEVARALGREHKPPDSKVLTAAPLEAALQRAGFTDVTTTRVEEHFVFDDADAYVAWQWTQGGRRIVEQLTPDELRRYRDLAAERLEADGYELVTHVEITVARRPGA